MDLGDTSAHLKEAAEHTALLQQQLLEATTKKLQEALQIEKQNRTQLWNVNCQQVRDFDEVLSEKEQIISAKDREIAILREQLSRLKAPSPGTSVGGGTTLSRPIPIDVVLHRKHTEKEKDTTADELGTKSSSDMVTRASAGARMHLSSPSEEDRPAIVSTSSDAGRRKGKAPPIDTFSGEDIGIYFDDWLPSLSRVAEWYGWSEEESLLQLAGHLRGKALHEWNLLSREEKVSYPEAVKSLRTRLGVGARVYAAQDFRHSLQEENESVANFIQRLERAFVLAYGRDDLTQETKHTLLHSQLQEGLKFSLMKSPAVSGAQSYKDLVLAAKNEEKRQSQLRKRQQHMPKQGGQPSPRPKRPLSEVKCHTCGELGHYQWSCKSKKTESSGKSTSNKSSATSKKVRTKPSEASPGKQDTLSSFLFSSSDESDTEVHTVRVSDCGSQLRVAKVEVQGVVIPGLVDTGADITIINGEAFKKVASVARLKKRQLKAVDKTPYGYDRRPFKLDGRMDLNIRFNDKEICTPVYIKLDAKDPLLLAEGVCSH